MNITVLFVLKMVGLGLHKFIVLESPDGQRATIHNHMDAKGVKSVQAEFGGKTFQASTLDKVLRSMPYYYSADLLPSSLYEMSTYLKGSKYYGDCENKTDIFNINAKLNP